VNAKTSRPARYVAGQGSDFVGIWDRERPGEPVERLPSDNSGLMQAGVETDDELLLVCVGNLPSEQDARQAAARAHAQGEWREVPEEVPRNLLETVRSVVAQ
jgi:hypothetical protein